MASLDTVSLSILFGATLVLAGILSSLVALRFGAPLLLVFLILGMLAGESGPGGIRFDDVRLTYLVGSIALALILFDGGLRTRISTFRSVLAPSLVLATLGVLLTAALTAPAVTMMMGYGWTEALLVGAVVASTDAAAVLFLLRARGLRLRSRVAATLEIESGTNDPFAIFLTILLVELLLTGDQPWASVAASLAGQGLGGAAIGLIGGRLIVLALNRLALPQGLHAPFVASAALGVFGLGQALHASGFLAVYLAGLMVGNRPTRAHGTVVVSSSIQELFMDCLDFEDNARSLIYASALGPLRPLTSAEEVSLRQSYGRGESRAAKLWEHYLHKGRLAGVL